MKSHIDREFVREVEKVFTETYPYLRIEFHRNGPRWLRSVQSGIEAEDWERLARELLKDEIRLTDEMTVGELEGRLKEVLGVPAVIVRRSGNFWIETSMTRNWTLKEQNEHGRELGGRIG